MGQGSQRSFRVVQHETPHILRRQKENLGVFIGDGRGGIRPAIEYGYLCQCPSSMFHMYRLFSSFNVFSVGPDRS
jgi:hypothetical protein